MLDDLYHNCLWCKHYDHICDVCTHYCFRYPPVNVNEADEALLELGVDIAEPWDFYCKHFE